MFKNPNASALALALHVDDAYDRMLLSVDADDGCPNSPWDDLHPDDDDDPGAAGALIAA